MAKPSDRDESRESVRDRLIGLGERSFRKSYYPQLQNRLDQLERFRRLLDCTTDAILLVELPTERVVDANLAACRQSGYPREELLALRLGEVFDLGPLPWPPLENPQAAANRAETVLRCSDGGAVPVEIDLSTERVGETSYAIVVARDISERLRAEESLHKSEWEKALILESTGELILYLDTGMRVIWANRAASRSFALGTEQLAGRHCWELWHGRKIPCQHCPVNRALETGKPQKGEVVTGDGRVWLIRGYPARNEVGKMEGVVEICLDITERKKAEAAVLESNRMKTEFISTAAHELRTPLTAIQGFSQLLTTREGFAPEEQREFLSYIHEKSVALSRIVSDLLDIARAESGKGLSFNFVRSTVHELVEQARIFFRASANDHTLRVEIAGGDSDLAVDREKLAEVFENLLSNATKYSRPGSTVRLFGRPTGDCYEFGIADQGIGMTPEEVERIYDKFYRADASTTAPSGLGLGMSLVKTIIETHGGRIWVKSRPSKGTTVYFSLPLKGGQQ